MKLLHPTDFSDCATQAERQAVRLARALGAELVLFHASVGTPSYNEGLFGGGDTQQFLDAQRAWVRETLIARAEAIRGNGIAARWVLADGVPHEEIVKAAANEDADIIVMGTHGRTGIDRMLLGSVTDRVIRLAPCPVLTVRSAEDE
jgi:nucleotide-binding universal stress UspA family protein